MEYIKEFLSELLKFTAVGIFIGISLRIDRSFRPLKFSRNRRQYRLMLKDNENLIKEKIIELGKKALLCPLTKSIKIN
jgi:hypothetical protein